MLSFGSASMLWWGLAAVIPFVLHLWNRRPRHVVPFAATRFIAAATKRQSRRLKFQQWLLLLTRVAILLLFALALAEPRWGGGATNMQGAIPTHHVLVIDDSYSMSAKIDSETRLELAKSRLIQIVRAAPMGDLFSVITLGSPPEILLAGPSHDREEIERVIDKLSVRQVGAGVRPALSVARRLIEEGQAISSSPRAAQVTIASDLAKNTWAKVTPEQINEELLTAAPGCHWNMIAIGDATPRKNLSILEFAAKSNSAYVGQSISGEVVLANTGAEPIENAILEIVNGDQVLFQVALTLAPNQQQTIPWQISPQRASVQLVARIGFDDLEVDNRRYLNVEVRQAPRLLCLTSSPEAARHVTIALTSGPFETRPRVEVRELKAEEMTKPKIQLTGIDAVLLLNLPPPRGEFAVALKSFVKNGGGLLVGLGDRAALSGGMNDATSDLYPAVIGPLMKLDEPRLDPMTYSHPLLAAFRDAPEVGLLSLPVWRYHKLENMRSTAKVAARFGNGDVALVEEPLGRGRIVLFASSLGAESVDLTENPPAPWAGLPGSAAYVPIIQEWVMRCASSEPEPQRFVGDPPPTAFSNNEKQEYSDGGAWRPLTDTDRTLSKAGFYRAATGGGNNLLFSVNLDANESRHESERLRLASWIAGGSDDRSEPRPQNTDLRTMSAKRVYQSLSVWLLIPLLILVCGEVVLATILRRKPRSRVRMGAAFQ